MTELVSDRIENNVGKGENSGYKHFLLFPHHFQQSMMKTSADEKINMTQKNIFTFGRTKK